MRKSIVIGGVWAAEFGGNSTSSLVLRQAFEAAGFEIYSFGFRRDWRPGRPLASINGKHLDLHTRPLACHSEGILHRRFTQSWLDKVQPYAVWILNSRHVSALPTGIPYIVWEPTTWRDEIDAGRAGMKMQRKWPGPGRMLHSVMRPLDRRSEQAALRRAAVVAAMSQHTARCIVAEKLTGQENICLLSHPPTRSFEQLAASLDPRPEAKTDFIAVARWNDPRKGASLLEQAVTHLSAKGEKYSWTLVGEGASELAARLRLAGAAAAAAQAPDDFALVSLIKGHRYLVIPSLQEGFGIAGIEAFHCRVPVVTTRCGGPEDYVEDGRTGFIGPADGKGLAQALSRAGKLEEREHLRMAHAARRVATTRFSNEQFTENLLRVTCSVFGD